MITRIVEACARNRLIVLLGVAFATLGAIWAIRRVKLDAIPDLSDPQVIVFTEWMGRSPTLVEDQVTYPLVSGLVSAPKVKDVRGQSMFGMSFVYVVFEEGTDPYWARSRVNELLGGLRTRLPPGASPVLGPDASGVGWTFQYTLVDKSGKHGLDELRTFQDFTLRYALGSVPGVAEVASVGGYQKQFQITVDPQKLAAYDVTLQDVAAAVRDGNDEVGGRVMEMSGREYYVRGRGFVQSLGDVEKIALRTSAAGTPVRIGDVGTVRFGPDIRRGLLEWNGEGEAVGGIVVMRYGENALDVIQRVKTKLGELRPSFPEGVDVEIAYDRSGLIGRSVDTLERALIEEIVVVAIVIVLFLLHVRSSLLPILSLPIAVALSFVPMWLLDLPSTIMSLGGIAIAIGATVDAEIVMIEASHKKLEGFRGTDEERRRKLAEAAREVTPAIFFSLLIVAVAFLPVFTLNGQAGRLFKPLAYTKTFVMLISAVLSITFAPALRDLLIRGKIRSEERHPISRAIRAVYEPFVFVALRKPKSTIAIGLLAVASAVPLYLKLGHEFMPPLDEGDLLYMPITMPNVSIEEAKRQLEAQDRVLKAFPEVASVFGKVGRAETPTDPAPLTMVETTVRLRPKAQWRRVHQDRWWSKRLAFAGPALRKVWPDERPISWDELTAQMNRAMQFPGWTNAYTMPIKTRIDMLSTGVRTPVGVKIQGKSLDEIEQVGVALEGVLAPVRGTRSVVYERSLGGLYVDVVPDRDALARFGVSVGDVERTIEAAVGGAPIGVTIEGRGRFSINVRYPQDVRDDLEKLRQIRVPVNAPGADGGGGSNGGNGNMDGRTGAIEAPPSDLRLAQMSPMGGGSPAQGPLAAPAAAPTAADFATPPLPGFGSAAPDGMGSVGTKQRWVPLGQLAKIEIASGPPMVRDEGGLLTGYVYVDVDPAQRDVGGYVEDAKAAVAAATARGALKLPPGTFLQWTGQYELLEQMSARMKIVVPVTLAIIVILLFLQFRNLLEVLIVLLSIPFALVGSVWLLWALDYRVSTAVWVGVIALVGLAAQTGVVMIVYIDHAYERRKAAGKIRDLSDIVWAHMEGTVQRVRPKLMTVGTMLCGLVPLLWAEGSGADVMKRVAVPMIGGLLTSAFLTLEIIPVVYTYWRYEQLLWERLPEVGGGDRALVDLRGLARVQAAAWGALVVVLVTRIYVVMTPATFRLATLSFLGCALLGGAAYVLARRSAQRLVWLTPRRAIPRSGPLSPRTQPNE